MVVAAAELHEGKPLARKRRHVAEDFFDRAQPGIRDLGFRRYLPDHAHQALFSERNENPIADIRPRRILRAVIEQLRQRHIESDAQDDHSQMIRVLCSLLK